MEFYDYTLREMTEMSCAVCRETLAIPHQPFFRRTQEGWQQGHHHGSMDAPGLLACLQHAVPGR